MEQRMTIEPLVFVPYLRPQIWGGRNLERFGKHLPDTGTFGESWEISGHPHHVSTVADGPFKGQSLTELCKWYPRELFGQEAPAEFPLLIKLLDCKELLSVQVHPDDATAARLRPGEKGKTEAWIVLESEPTAQIYAGLKPGIDASEFRRHVENTTTGDCLHRFHPKVGDCLYLAAGTVHTLGGGVIVAEVQQSSDATFRLFDWNRIGADGKPRQLHIEESLESIDWNAGPLAPIVPEPITGLSANVTGRRLIESKFFSVDRYDFAGDFTSPNVGCLSIGMVLKGDAILKVPSTGYQRALGSVESVLVPASCPPCVWQSASSSESCQLLSITLPTRSDS